MMSAGTIAWSSTSGPRLQLLCSDLLFSSHGVTEIGTKVSHTSHKQCSVMTDVTVTTWLPHRWLKLVTVTIFSAILVTHDGQGAIHEQLAFKRSNTFSLLFLLQWRISVPKVLLATVVATCSFAGHCASPSFVALATGLTAKLQAPHRKMWLRCDLVLWLSWEMSTLSHVIWHSSVKSFVQAKSHASGNDSWQADVLLLLCITSFVNWISIRSEAIGQVWQPLQSVAAVSSQCYMDTSKDDAVEADQPIPMKGWQWSGYLWHFVAASIAINLLCGGLTKKSALRLVQLQHCHPCF